MSNVKQFYQFLKNNGYKTSFDSLLSYKENKFVSYEDQGGYFRLDEDLTFEAEDYDSEETIYNSYNSYLEFLTDFKNIYGL